MIPTGAGVWLEGRYLRVMLGVGGRRDGLRVLFFS